MHLYPAIDLLGGRVVRLRQGDYADETVYGDDAVAVARGFVASGATWVHVVDLDAARSGDPVNRPVVAAIAAAVAGQARVQTGGGVRSLDDARELADAGVARVVMGSAAVRDPSLVEAASEIVPVAVGLDHRDGEIAVHGWTEGSGLLLDDALVRFPTADVFVVTDIGRDGMLLGPDLDGLRRSAQIAGSPVIASGGVSSLADVVALAQIPNIGGVITGKAIYEGRFTVVEALDALAAA
ncbi:MAG TPA: HisA/HisF-related TIM barrel protein [Ilumatobacteraceae bacterium]|nr:HisA/HisF-related TIM barrel protein [Ilumatobacteraceae bacterium]